VVGGTAAHRVIFSGRFLLPSPFHKKCSESYGGFFLTPLPFSSWCEVHFSLSSELRDNLEIVGLPFFLMRHFALLGRTGGILRILLCEKERYSFSEAGSSLSFSLSECPRSGLSRSSSFFRLLFSTPPVVCRPPPDNLLDRALPFSPLIEEANFLPSSALKGVSFLLFLAGREESPLFS